MTVTVDHIGIAVENLTSALPFWSEVLDLRVAGIETVDTEGVKVAFLPAGDARVELLEPTRADSPVARFLAKRGAGIHHVTFRVARIEPVLEQLEARGVPMLDRAPRPGAEGSRVAFLHPKATGGVLVELVERAAPAGAPSRGLAPGDPLLVYLRDPHEKMWGVLRERDASGVTIEGMDLASVDAWTKQVERAEDGIVPSVLFFPMARVERILLDRGTPGLPSLSETFLARTGRRVQDVLGA
jgi:methylmalonyl-CoA/ethylmalonyl-CoA epimerase